MKKEWTDLLLRSLDEQLTKEETLQLEQALAISADLRKEQAELLKMRQLFTNFSVEKKEGFVDSIMDSINALEVVAKRRITAYLSQIYPKAVAACVLVLMSFMVYIYLSEGNFDAETLVGISDLSPEEAYSFLLEE